MKEDIRLRGLNDVDEKVNVNTEDILICIVVLQNIGTWAFAECAKEQELCRLA